MKTTEPPVSTAWTVMKKKKKERLWGGLPEA